MLNTMAQLLIGIVDLVAAFLLIYGLKRMSSPVTAPSGIFVAGGGMLVAILASFLYIVGVRPSAHAHLPLNVGLAVAALIIGGGAAWWSGKRVAMTSMPQMVALYNGMGGGAAAAIAAMELLGKQAQDIPALSITLIGALIGSVSLSGSLIAWAKLDGRIKQALRFSGQQVANGLVMLATLLLGGYIVAMTQTGATPLLSMPDLIYLFFGLALLFGVLMTLPIGAAGLLLTLLMAKAMNRSVGNVIFTNFGTIAKSKPGAIAGELKPVDAGDAGIFMRYASSVIVVPGYGLAVAHGQQKLYEFVKLLQAAGVTVKFAVHPVAGRMPGQMDVLLAEANVPYDMIFQLEDINDEFSHTDAVLVIGANDVVNPAARTDKSSPIFGMPILNVDQAKKVYVVKRGEGRRYAGIVNALFYADNCDMVYGDAQASLIKMIEAVRGLGAAAA